RHEAPVAFQSGGLLERPVKALGQQQGSAACSGKFGQGFLGSVVGQVIATVETVDQVDRAVRHLGPIGGEPVDVNHVLHDEARLVTAAKQRGKQRGGCEVVADHQ